MKNNGFAFTLDELLFLIGMKARSGELVVEAGNNIGTILFHQGRILHAFSPYSRAIGDLLVDDGRLSETELIETLKIQKRSAYEPLGALLIQLGRVSLDDIERMVGEQIRQAVKEFQSWKHVTCSFSNKAIKPHDRIHVMVHEFISPETIRSAQVFLSQDASGDNVAPADPSSAAASSLGR